MVNKENIKNKKNYSNHLDILIMILSAGGHAVIVIGSPIEAGIATDNRCVLDILICTALTGNI